MTIPEIVEARVAAMVPNRERKRTLAEVKAKRGLREYEDRRRGRALGTACAYRLAAMIVESATTAEPPAHYTSNTV